MKRRHLFNKIISLSIVATLYLTMSAGAFAEADGETIVENEPVAEACVEESVAEVASEAVEEVSSDDALDTTYIPEESVATSGVIAVVDEELADAIAGEISDDEMTSDALSEEVIEDEDDGDAEDEDLEEEDLEECEHELTYTSNKDGSHTVSCDKCDMDSYTETCDYDDDGICNKCGYKRLPDPVLVYEDEEVVVTVSGAIPENADLKVTPIKKDKDETKQAYEAVDTRLKEKIDIDEANAYGFLAYDISFKDIETSEEVEPTGDVNVKMEYKAAIMPDNADEINSCGEVEISLVHFNEQTDTVENLSDLSRADCQIDNNNALTKAEFSSDSFSTYVVTWVATSSASVKLNFKLYDNSDTSQELTGKNTTYDLSSSDTAEITAEELLTDQVDYYSFVKATYNNKEINKFSLSNYTLGSGRTTYYYKVTITYSDTTQTTLDSKNYSNKLSIDINAYYKQNSNLSVAKKATGIYKDDTETEYEFSITDASGNPVANEGFVVGEETKATDENGKFTLKTKERADFDALADGQYKITEVGVIGEAKLTDFYTYIVVGQEIKERYEWDTEEVRAITVDVSSSSKPQVVFKNYYTTSAVTSSVIADTSKFIQYNGPEKEDYKLNVKFNGPEEIVTHSIFWEEEIEEEVDAKVNIILLIDKSISMNQKTRLTNANDAIKQMVSIFKEKQNVDAKWAVVDFNKEATVKSNGWVDTDDVTSAINTSLSEGTNYQAAFIKANELIDSLDEDRKDATTMVVFMTDGSPTAYITDSGSIYNNSNHHILETTYSKSIEAAGELKCDKFYAVGVDLENTYSIYNDMDKAVTYTKGSKEILKEIKEAVTGEENPDVYTVDSKDLEKIFADIAGQIITHISGENETRTTKYYASNVTFTDKLSEYVDIEPNSTFYISVQEGTTDLQSLGKGKWEGFDGVIGADGRMETAAQYEIYEGDTTYTLTANYDADTKTFSLVFPDGYVLDDGYSYSISFNVIPSDMAYEKYLNDGYNAIGDEATDNLSPNNLYPNTSVGQEGFFSNDATYSKVEYSYKGEVKEVAFPRPVIQVHFFNQWEIYKVAGEGDNQIGLADAKFKLEDTESDSGISYTGQSVGTDGKQGLVTWQTTDSITTGKTYKLTETEAPYGYMRDGSYWMMTLSSDNVPTVEVFDSDGVSQGTYQVEPTRSGNVYTYKLYYKDLTSYNLPDTGGCGTETTKAAGVVMIMMAAYMLFTSKKRQGNK